MPLDTCANCGVPIQEFLTGRKSVHAGTYCNNCFYDAMGALIEAAPVGASGASRVAMH
jgi:hypothetical protein